MPGMMMKAKKPMSYKKGGMVGSPGKSDVYKDANSAMKGAKKRGEASITFRLAAGKSEPMHKMPNGKMMPGAKHGVTKPKK